jgi:hypothetical protein
MERRLGGIARYPIRYERRADLHLAFLTLVCALIRFRSLQRFCY